VLHQSFGRALSVARRIVQHAAQISRGKPLPKHGNRRQRPLRRPGSPRSEVIAIVVAVSATNYMRNVHSAAIFLQRRIQLVTIQTARMLKYGNNFSPGRQALARACALSLAPNRAAGAEHDKKDDRQPGPGTQHLICPVEVSVFHIADTLI